MTARLIDLGHELHQGMDMYHVFPPFLRVDLFRLGDRVSNTGVTLTADMIICPTHSGTHVDALGHVGHLEDGQIATNATYAEDFPVFYQPGVLIDVSGELADDNPVIPVSLLREKAETVGAPLAGAVVLIRTGWERWWGDPSRRYGEDLQSQPGIDLEGARYLADAGATAVGADTPMLEAAQSAFAVHQLFLEQRGIYIFENVKLAELADSGSSSFTFTAAPLRIRGGTGAPVRPVAVLANT